MKTLTAILLACGLAILTTLSVSAQEQTEPRWMISLHKVDCTSVQEMFAMLKTKYEEQPFATGTVVAQQPQPGQDPIMHLGLMWMTINPTTGSYSLVGIFNQGTDIEMACLIASGAQFSPARRPGTSL